MDVTFLGGAGTVTGSKFLVDGGGYRILVDCGLFQGGRSLRERNWAPFSVDPASIDAVVLTHAHLDHSGYLPVLVRKGFKGPVLCSEATRDICALLLPDSGYLQERDAEYANRHGFARHRPALPLYSEDEARATLDRFRPIGFDTEHRIKDGLALKLSPSGHILGSASVTLYGSNRTLAFSGDLGRPNSPTMVDPAPLSSASHLFIESTYGNRRHANGDPAAALAAIINQTAIQQGVVLIPSFAIGRVQTVLYYILQLKSQNRIPDVPVFLDSPMAINASDIFCRHLGEHRLEPAQCRALCGVAQYVRTVEESKRLGRSSEPRIIVSASGMAEGGRIVHHLKSFAPDKRNALVFVGYQAMGTRGAAIVNGAKSVKIHGQDIAVRARVHNLEMLSAHADVDEIIAWLQHLSNAPRMTFIVHGETDASEALRDRIESELGWPCRVPELGEQITLN